MASFLKEMLNKKRAALKNIRVEVAVLARKVLESPMDKRAPYWEIRLFQLIELIPQKENLINILKRLAKEKKVMVQKRVLAPGEWFSSLTEIQMLLVPTIAVVASKDNKGGFVVFSDPMDPKRIQRKLESRPVNPRLKDLVTVFYDDEADPKCSGCGRKKLPKTNLCQNCTDLYLQSHLLIANSR